MTLDFLSDGVEDIQSLISYVNVTSERFGLRVSSTETEVQLIAREKQQLQLHSPLMQAHDSTYLESILSSDETCDKDYWEKSWLSIKNRQEKVRQFK